ncbi:MAG: acyltransferase [Verrucomicrobiota bacterium]
MASSGQSVGNPQWGGLNLLRGVAIILVLGRHMPFDPATDVFPGAAFLRVWKQCGWMGVDLFFVLSGFLVSSLLLGEYKQTSGIKPGRFLIRRSLKILPVFFLFLLVTITLAFLHSSHLPPVSAIVSEFLFVQNYGPSLWNHTWSLAVEVHFYLIVTLFAVLASRHLRLRPFIPGFLLLCLSICFVARCLTALAWPFGERIHMFPTHLRLDSMGAGVLIAWAWQQPWMQPLLASSRWALFPLVGLVLWPVFVPVESAIWCYTLGLTFLYIGFGALLLLTISSPGAARVERLPLMLPLAWIGQHSYSIYLWHMPMKFWPRLAVERVMGVSLPTWIACLLYVVCGIVFGGLMSTWIELRILAIRDKYFPRTGMRSANPPISSRMQKNPAHRPRIVG